MHAAIILFLQQYNVHVHSNYSTIHLFYIAVECPALDPIPNGAITYDTIAPFNVDTVATHTCSWFHSSVRIWDSNVFSWRDMVRPHSCVPTYVIFKIWSYILTTVQCAWLCILIIPLYIHLFYRGGMSSTGTYSQRSYYIWSWYDCSFWCGYSSYS